MTPLHCPAIIAGATRSHRERHTVSTPQRAKAIFLAALDAPDRAAYLATACGDDTELRARVEQLLRSHDDNVTVNTRPAAARTAGPAAGGVIAERYVLAELIGEGGMGSVWRAEQRSPVRRPVAVKLIKPGMDSGPVIARFKAERQALAVMDHPGIARVFDAGLDHGRPFFVMELVAGSPITAYCDDHRLTVRQRLTLFALVCHAIQHAHQKGIIHRDIKASNVLVAEVDGKPVPKVIDFGIAKAVGGDLTAAGPQTQHCAVVGTPQSMSPEQAGLNPHDIDTRSDVYALGSLLYELLAGSPPFRTSDFPSGGLLEVLRAIREVEPPSPSVRLVNDPDCATIADKRASDPRRFVSTIRGELDWIVGRAVEKDRDRRYQSAAACAADVERYLADDAVHAGPPSRLYRARKFLRRHRGAVIAASLVLLSLIGGIVGTTVGLVRARESADAERAAKVLAEKRADQNKAVVASLGGIFQNVDVRDDRRAAKPLKVVLGERLAAVAATLDGDSVADPTTAADMQHTIGMALRGLGRDAEALTVLKKSHTYCHDRIGPDHEHTLAAQMNTGLALEALGRHTEARAVLQEVVDRRTRTLGPADPSTLVSRNNLAITYNSTKEYAAAAAIFEAIIPLQKVNPGPYHYETLGSMNNLSLAYQGLGRMAEAGRILTDVLRLKVEHAGPDHPDTLHVRHNLGHYLTKTHQLAEAVPVVEEALRRERAVYGPEHAIPCDSLQLLTNVHREAGRFVTAATLGEELVRLFKRADPADRQGNTLNAQVYVAQDYLSANRPASAEPYVREALPNFRKRMPDHWGPFYVESMLGECLANGPDPAQAEKHLLAGHRGLTARAAIIPDKTRDGLLADATARLVRYYETTGDAAKAAEWRSSTSITKP